MKKNNMYLTEADVETKFIYAYLLEKVLDVSGENVSFHVPVRITQGRKTLNKEADVLIKNDKGENVVVIDSKAPDEKLDTYFDQIDSYAFKLETPISILSNYYRTVIRIYLSGNKKEIIFDQTIDQMESDNFNELKEIVKRYTDNPEAIFDGKKADAEKAKIVDYRRLFRQIHTKIRSIDKLDPSASFDEFSKILFIKIINDKIPAEERLTPERIKVFGTTKEQSNYVDTWFQKKVKEHYPGIFANNVKISASSNALIAILETLDGRFDLKDSLNDIKGRAFEEFLPSQLRGKGLGQFFTPRSVVEFMIELADISITDKVLDFASGSGGFLIKAFDRKRKLIEETQQQYLDLIGKTREQLLEDTKTQIFGIDAEPRAVRTAKMNMLLWGDGKQIQHGNGLDIKDYTGTPYFAKEYSESDPDSGVDIILANPPFGSTEEDQNILAKYTLSKKVKKKDDTGKEYIVNQKEKTEHLFIEKAFKMLRPNGKLLIVLPEGIFSNNDSKVRDYVLSHFVIDTIVKLPKHTFVMSGVDTINTVILIARKNSAERMKKIKLADKKTWINSDEVMTINFASVNQTGFEPSGKAINGGYSNSDLKILANKITNGDLSEILADPIEYADLAFSDDNKNEAWKESMVKFLTIDFTSVPKRLDPTYYFFREESKEIMKSFVGLDITEDNLGRNRLTEQELIEDVEKTYTYISVVKTIDGSITATEEKTVDELLASDLPQKLQYGDIVFNPYRINTGSIILIDSHEKNLVTSPAYVVVRDLKIDSKYFVQLLKTPFMKYQIQVLASGSVRDNFSGSNLYELKIPNIDLPEQKNLVLSINIMLEKIKEHSRAIDEDINSINSLLSSF